GVIEYMQAGNPLCAQLLELSIIENCRHGPDDVEIACNGTADASYCGARGAAALRLDDEVAEWRARCCRNRGLARCRRTCGALRRRQAKAESQRTDPHDPA